MRQLETATLEKAALDYSRMFLSSDRKSKSGKVFIDGPSRVLQDFNNFHFSDEQKFLLDNDAGIKAHLGGKSLAEFEKLAKEKLRPRTEAELVKALRDKLAIDPNGNHIPGAIGSVVVGTRPIAMRLLERETPDSVRRRRRRGFKIHVEGRKDREVERVLRMVRWNVYAGEAEERKAGSKIVDPLPDDALPTTPDGRLAPDLGAKNPNIAAVAAIASADAIVDLLDGGSTAASIRLRTGAQPADPDASESGTLLGTLVMSDPAFGNAVDDSPGGLATADTISDDASADATNTATYFRAGATGTGADDILDGTIGTSDADMVMNTVSIVAGAVLSVISFTLLVPQGATAA